MVTLVLLLFLHTPMAHSAMTFGKPSIVGKVSDPWMPNSG
jgi:hypothetical protein